MVFNNQLDRVDLSRNSSGEYGDMWQTDIPRLQAGKVGAQVRMFGKSDRDDSILIIGHSLLK
jgi:hypothetical protein